MGPNHALLAGMVVGALIQHATPEFDVEPESDENGWTGRALIRRPSGTWAVSVVPVDVEDTNL